nr:putative ribonuclease H-like domain-containing protein [Tanacetum cinerariifolium]
MGHRIPQSNVPLSVTDEAITKEMHYGLGWATTTASSSKAEQGSGNISKTQTKATSSGPSSSRTSSEGGPWCHVTMVDIPVQARAKGISNLPNEPPLREGNTSRSGEGSMQLLELMDICIKLSDKKLEKKLEHKRRREVINSSEDQEGCLDHEDSPKHGRMIKEVDEDEYVNLVQSNDDETFGEILVNIKKSAAKDKGKAIMQESEPPKKIKKKEMMQISLGEEIAQRNQDVFDNTIESVRKFVPMESEGQITDSKAGEGSSKEGESLKRLVEEENEYKKDAKSLKQIEKEIVQEEKDKIQKKHDDLEKLTLMDYMEVISDSEEVISVTPLAVKSPIVNWKSYYKGDVEKYASTRQGFDDLILWGDMKIIFKPDGDDEVWKNHHNQGLLEWELYDSCGFHSLMLGEKGNDPIDAINHMMSFLSAVVTSCYPTTTNQLRNSSNPRQQDTINDGRVTLQPVQERQVSFATGTTRTYTLGANGSNSRKQRIVICYNYKGEGHMSKQCTKPKRKQDDAWFKDKRLPVQAQENGKIQHKEELAFLTDPEIKKGQATQTIITHNATYQADDLYAYESNCDELNTAKWLSWLICLIMVQMFLLRYKEQVKVLKEGQNVEVQSQDNFSDLHERNAEIDRLKQTLSELLQEKESLMKTVTVLKNDFKKEESRNIDREISLENKIKHLDNIVHKRDQSAQTNSMNSSNPSPSCTPTKVEVSKELPKVSMVYTSLKKLKHHLANFDVVVKERTTTTTITKGSWVFEDTKACFRDEVIPFVNALKNIFNTFDQYLIDELTEDQNVFHQMGQEKGLIIATLKDELRKLKEKALVDNVVTTHTIAPEMLQIDIEPLASRLLNNRAAHSDYLRLTQERAVILKEVAEQGKSQNPLNNSLDSGCCPNCSLAKARRNKPKSEDTKQEKLYILHMDLYGPMRVQNGAAERRNHTLIEVSRTMLIYAKASLFLWAEAVATARDNIPSPSARSKDYDEEKEMEPRSGPARAVTPPLQAASPRVRRRRERVVRFEETQNRGESRVERNSKGKRPSEEAPRGNGSQNVNLPPLLAAHIERSENGQHLQSSLTSVYGGQALPNNVGGNLPLNGQLSHLVKGIKKEKEKSTDTPEGKARKTKKMGIVVSTIHGAIKFHTKKGVRIVLLVGEAREETRKARRTLTISKERIPSCDDTEEKIIMNDKYLEQMVTIGK